MDVLLIKPYSNIFNILPPLGLGYLASALKEERITSKIIHCNKDNYDIKKIVDLIKKEKIKVVGIGCCSNEHPWLEKFAREIEPLPWVNLVVGGPHATGLSKRLFRLIPRINYIIRGEGEKAFPSLVRHILKDKVDDDTLCKVPNLVWRDTSNNSIENALEFIAPLDALSMPDWEQLDLKAFSKFSPHGSFARATPVAQIITTRGCPYKCRYCASPLCNGDKVRKRSAESIVTEIEYLVNRYDVKEIHIEDDNFTFDPDHVVSVCEAIRKNKFRLFFGLPNGVRIDRLNKEILDELKNTGFYFLSIGIESGSPRILKAMNKSIDIERIRSGVKLIRGYDFILKGFFMIGYPGEKVEDIMATIEFAKSLDLDQAFFSLYIPLPGTAEFERLEKEGLIDIHQCDWESFYTGKFSKMPFVPEGMTEPEIRKLLSLAFRSFYLRPQKIIKMLKNADSLIQITSYIKAAISLMR